MFSYLTCDKQKIIRKPFFIYDTRLYKKENEPTDIFFDVYAEKASYLRYRYINKKKETWEDTKMSKLIWGLFYLR